MRVWRMFHHCRPGQWMHIYPCDAAECETLRERGLIGTILERGGCWATLTAAGREAQG